MSALEQHMFVGSDPKAMCETCRRPVLEHAPHMGCVECRDVGSFVMVLAKEEGRTYALRLCPACDGRRRMGTKPPPLNPMIQFPGGL
jgi:hypothetical protein